MSTYMVPKYVIIHPRTIIATLEWRRNCIRSINDRGGDAGNAAVLRQRYEPWSLIHPQMYDNYVGVFF